MIHIVDIILDILAYPIMIYTWVRISKNTEFINSKLNSGSICYNCRDHISEIGDDYWTAEKSKPKWKLCVSCGRDRQIKNLSSKLNLSELKKFFYADRNVLLVYCILMGTSVLCNIASIIFKPNNFLNLLSALSLFLGVYYYYFYILLTTRKKIKNEAKNDIS